MVLGMDADGDMDVDMVLGMDADGDMDVDMVLGMDAEGDMDVDMDVDMDADGVRLGDLLGLADRLVDELPVTEGVSEALLLRLGRAVHPVYDLAPLKALLRAPESVAIVEDTMPK
jgi:hypothetical protein